MCDIEHRCVDFETDRERWDQWLCDAANPGGSQISAHLGSFRDYRAEVTLHVLEDRDGNWLAGAGLVSWRIPAVGSPFGIAVGGPAGDTKHWPQLIASVAEWCRRNKWMCVEFSPHVPATCLAARDALEEAGFKPASIFAPVSGLGADLRVPLTDITEEALLRSFRRQTRQHVERSLCEGYELCLPSSSKEVDDAVEFFYETTLENGISFGPKRRFHTAVHDLVQSKTGYIGLVTHDGRPLAGGVWVRVGSSHSCYRLATRRDDQHRRSAYFLHWHAMLRARQDGAAWYFLTGRSTSSVYQFKRGFRPEEFELLPSHRLVLRPGLMRGVETIRPMAMKTARRMLATANRLRGRG